MMPTTKHLRRLTSALLIAFAAGCGGGTGPEPASNDPDPEPGVLAWNTVPAMVFTTQVSVDTDLRTYLRGPKGSAVISLDNSLPAGLRLEGGVIRGTPTAATASADYVASADEDGTGANVVTSSTFSIEVKEPPANDPIQFERATPHQIGMLVPFGTAEIPNAPPADAKAAVRYRKVSDSSWSDAHPLLRIHPEWNQSDATVPPVDSFAGTIFGLEPGSSYTVEVTITAPSFTTVTLQSVQATRSLPSASGSATVTVSPSDDLQSAVDSLQPGDVLELSAGTYAVSPLEINVSGTSQAPITIRGASRASVKLSRSDGSLVQFIRASHVVLENMTLEGSGSDSGTNASSRAVSFWDGALQEFITIRDLDVVGVDQGVIASGRIHSVLVYNCDMRGNNLWNANFVETNLTWNDDGIRVPGAGNCVFNNTMHAFGDTFAVTRGVDSTAVYFYRNRVTMTGDDAWEADYGTRNMAFYDNHITNCGTLMSCDPIWGGPVYCFRNIAINTIRGPFKFNSQQSGMLVYNNTIARTDGTTGWGWVQFHNGNLRGWSYRNNLLVYQGGSSLMAMESGGQDPIDFSHNGWYPDGDIWWSNSGPSGSSLASVQASMPSTTPLFGTATKRHDNDVLLAAEPFTTTIPLGNTHLTQITSEYIPTLGSGSVAKGAGTPIPNITDGHSGAAPDMGAVIGGRANPSWGAPR